jgi:hypothetical protein
MFHANLYIKIIRSVGVVECWNNGVKEIIMAIQGAGGTSGGIGRFFIGLIMMIAGGYLFLNAIRITHHFHLRRAIYSFGGRFNLTSGMVLIPLIFGIGFIFYNYKNLLGWILSIASLIMLGFGVISSIQFRMQNMSAFELIMVLILMIGGIGLFLSSFRTYDS